PTVVRDRNGDVWAAFWRLTMSGIFITHTYTRATTTRPVVSAQGSHQLVQWTLSEPAPETWWAVLRSVDGGPYELASRVRAGAGVQMSWDDSLPPSGTLSYRIRRECVDTRFEWLSDPSDAAVPALATLANVDAEPGIVSLTWYSTAGTASPNIYRRTPTTD